MEKNLNRMTDIQFDQRFANSTFLVSLGSIISFIASAALQIIIAALFGAGYDMDAYFTSAVIPTYFISVMTTGLTFVLVPAVINEERIRGARASINLVGSAIFYTLLILIGITILIAMTSETLIGFTAPGLSESQRSTTATLLQIQVLALPFMGLGTMSSGVRNAKNSFLLPALGPGIGSLVNIIVILFSQKSLGVTSLAWGFVAAQAAFAIFNFLPIMDRDMRKLLPVYDKRIIELAKLTLPFILFGIIQRSLPVLERYFASGLPSGQMSYLGYSSKVSNMLILTLGTGIATSLLPSLSRAYVEDGKDGLSNICEQGLKTSVSFSIPVIIFFFVAGEAITGLFLGRGQFDAKAIQSVGTILGWTAIIVSMAMMGNVLGRSFYAMKITWLTPLLGAFGVFIYLIFAGVLLGKWEFLGLVVAQVMSTSFSVFMMTVVLMSILKTVFKEFWKLLFLLALLGIVLSWIILQLLAWLSIGSYLMIILLSGSIIIISFSVFFYIYDQQLLQMILQMTGVNRILRLAHLGNRC